MRKTNILLYGSGGAGKSTSIATVFKLLTKIPNLKVRYLCTESNALVGMEDGLKRHKIELKPGQLHYQVCRPNPLTSVTSSQIVKEYEDNFLKLSDSDALKVKVATGDRAKRTAFITILKGMAVFKGIDYVTKEIEDLGDYLKWDSDTIFVIDSLTSCVDYLVAEVKATRVATIMSDYQHVQSNLMSKIIIPLTEQSQCSIIMLGHPTMGEDQTVKQPKAEEDKIMKLYPKTFGQALNDSIVSKFSETIYSYIDRQDNFYWAGKMEGVATSPRRIPRESKLVQDFSKYNIFED
jgi:hypothetical protein